MIATRRLRFGIVGFGAFAERSVLPAMRDVNEVEIVALHKRSPAEADARARQYGVSHAFSSAQELVAHPDVDAVFIASANSTHCADTVAAAGAGKHVLVEKPMALNVGEVETMIRACREAGVRLMVGHLVRFSPLVLRVRDLIRSGALGTITYARADFSYDGRLSRRTWLRDRAVAGGGPVFDIGVHCLDTLRFVLDDEVASVRAVLAPEPAQDRTEQSAVIGLQFSRGTIGSIFCSYAAPMRRKQLEIIGTEGVVTAGDFTSGTHDEDLVIAIGTNAQSRTVHTETIRIPNLISEEIRHFAAAVLSGSDLVTPGENGLANQRVLDAILAGTDK